MGTKLVFLAVVAIMTGCAMNVERDECAGMESFAPPPSLPVRVSGDDVAEVDAFGDVFERVDGEADIVVSVVDGDGVECGPVVDDDGRGLAAASWFEFRVGRETSDEAVVAALGECILRVSGVVPGCESEAVEMIR